jgi:nitrogenase iron protein NifH
MLMAGRLIPTVMDQVRERGVLGVTPADVVYTGFNGVHCVEAGGPEPGVGCAGRGIIATFQLLEKFGTLTGDVIVYDVLGDVVCGGFAMPMREGYAQEVYLVTSGELMSLYAANNICKAIERLSARPKSRCRLAGVICNAKSQPKEEELVAEFARRVNSHLVQFIPRDRVVQLAELNRKTVIEYEPASAQAQRYRDLATRIMENTRMTVPTPLEIDDLEALAIEFM